MPRCISPNCLNDSAQRCKRCHKCIARKWRANNPEKAAYKNAKGNAKRRGIPFLLTYEEYISWGKQHDYFKYKGTDATSYSIDRMHTVDMSGNIMGYTIDNIQILTVAENTAKANKDRAKAFKRRSYCPREPGDPF